MKGQYTDEVKEIHRKLNVIYELLRRIEEKEETPDYRCPACGAYEKTKYPTLQPNGSSIYEVIKKHDSCNTWTKEAKVAKMKCDICSCVYYVER